MADAGPQIRIKCYRFGLWYLVFLLLFVAFALMRVGDKDILSVVNGLNEVYTEI